MIGLIAKWLIRSVLLGIILFGMWGCTMLGLNYSSLEVDSKPKPTPELSANFDEAAARQTLEDELFGPWPGQLPVQASELRMIDDAYLDGRGTLQEITITIGLGETARAFPVVVALPSSSNEKPVPLIISQTFSGNCSVFPDQPVTASDGSVCQGTNMTGFGGFMATQIFGTYIAYAPVERYLDAGLGYASFYGSSFVPDQSRAGPAVMASLGGTPAPSGALIAWAFGFAAIADELDDDPRIRADAIAALGHSRFGKSALIAAAWSDKIAAAIAHQSGFAGAASSRSTTGETLARMAESYPHWLRPGLSEDLEAGAELTLDQHYLLALTAPKPIFLGNGRRDVWSDPNSTFRIAQAADVIYEARGVGGLPDGGMQDYDPSAEIAYWLRVGGHSVISEDIDAFIEFMTAHFLGD